MGNLNLGDVPVRVAQFSVYHSETRDVVGAFDKFDLANEMKIEINKGEDYDGNGPFRVGHFWQYVEMTEDEIDEYER